MVKRNPPNPGKRQRKTAAVASTPGPQQSAPTEPKAKPAKPSQGAQPTTDGKPPAVITFPADWKPEHFDDLLYARPPKDGKSAAHIGVRFRGLAKDKPAAIPGPEKRVYKKLTEELDAATSSSSKGKQKDTCVDESDPEALQVLRELCIASNVSATELLIEALHQLPEDQECLPLPEGKGARALHQSADGDDEADDDNDANGEEEDEEGSDAMTKSGFMSHNGLDVTAPPLSNIHEVFSSLTKTALQLGLADAIKPFAGRKMRLFTMCSGTESPVIAMDLINKALAQTGVGSLEYQHLGSAEIEPQKQAFIERNFRPPVIFRDVTEFIAYAEDKAEAIKNSRPQKEEYRPYTAYGRRADPPEGVHILVAGSSCVDYSGLNNAKNQDGESYRTLMGVIAYARAHQPDIVILENVQSAPWGKVAAAWQEKGLDYYVMPVIVNSVNYYMPQTRNRGYCFLINNAYALAVGLDVLEAGREFVRGMARLQRRASSSYSDWILKEDDLRLHMAKANRYDFNNRDTMSDWTACRKRHLAVRADGQLGLSTPYTGRQNNSQPKVGDDAWQRWALAQTERVLDTLDINHLRYVSERDYDMRSKCRNFNVSQNVDRDEDRRQWGIVGCITPKGALFHTKRGGPLVGLEVFALQGMPIGDLNLSKDSSKELQDLAGNAMTTTVIGAAILSALIACHKATKQIAGSSSPRSIFQQYSDQFGSETGAKRDNRIPSLLSEDELINPVQQSSLHPLHREFSLQDAMALSDLTTAARASQPLCRCESLGLQTSELKLCPNCFYTTCETCSRDPHHGLQELSVKPESRRSLRYFIDILVQSLPPILALQGLSASVRDHFKGKATVSVATELITNAIREPLYFQGVHFNQSWKATYESDYGVLQLDFMPIFPPQTSDFQHFALEPTWLLFVKPPATEPVGSKLRNLLRHPVARMRSTQHLTSGDWMLWNGPEKLHKVQIDGHGVKVPAWEQTLGLKGSPFNTMEVFPELEIRTTPGTNGDGSETLRRIAGKYRLFQNCTASSGSLHRQVVQEQPDLSPIFFFLDPQPLGDGRLDCFVFATQPPRGNSVDDRSILARLPAPWRPALLDSKQGDQTNFELLDTWQEAPNLRLAVPKEGSQIRKWFREANSCAVPSLPCRNAASSLMVLEVPLNPKQQQKFPAGQVFSIELENKPEALLGFGWILSHASNVPYLHNGDEQDGKWQPLADAHVPPCRTCAPQSPKLRWLVKKVGKREIVKPFEDPKEAAEYEDALKHRPKPAMAMVHGHGAKAFLDIRVNVSTLIHRAMAEFSSSRPSVTGALESSWRLTRHDPFAARPSFSSLELLSNYDEQPIPNMHISDRSLWSSQRKTIAWMQRQEHEPPVWKQMALVESPLPALGWRLEAQATIDKEVRGGIIADDVGAGKTTTSLTLIGLDYENLRSPASSPFVTERHPTHINTDATLILVPKNIIKQWESECEECLGWTKYNQGAAHNPRPYYMSVISAKELVKLPVSAVESASLILASWDMFEDDQYWIPFRKVACAPDIPNIPGRAFSEWLEMSLRALGKMQEQSDGDETRFWNCWDTIRADTHNYDRFMGFKTRASNKAELAKEKKAAKEAPAADAANDAKPKGAGVKTKTAGRKRTRDEVESSDDDDVANSHADADVTKPTTAADAEKVEPKPVQPLKFDTDLPKDDPFQQELDEFRGKRIPPLLHMFSFRRIIVDEFTYIYGKTLLALLQLVAGSRWMLSGTPPIHDYDNVNTMAKLLGTRVSTYDEEGGKFTFGKDGSKMVKDRSDAQEFHSYQNLVSAAYATTVYEHAREFSDTFIRKNQPDIVLPKRHDYAEYFNLSPSEMTTYMEVDQLVEEQDIAFNRKPRPAAKVKGKGKDKAQDAG